MESFPMTWLLHCERTFFVTKEGRWVATRRPRPRFLPRREISSNLPDGLLRLGDELVRLLEDEEVGDLVGRRDIVEDLGERCHPLPHIGLRDVEDDRRSIHHGPEHEVLQVHPFDILVAPLVGPDPEDRVSLFEGEVLPLGVHDDKADPGGAEPLAEDCNRPALACPRLGDDAGAAGDQVLGVDGEVPVPGCPDDEIHKKPGRKKSIKLSPPSPLPAEKMGGQAIGPPKTAS